MLSYFHESTTSSALPCCNENLRQGRPLTLSRFEKWPQRLLRTEEAFSKRQRRWRRVEESDVRQVARPECL